MAAPDSPPVRMAHLGLGAFHRAHQAWYTDRANDGADEPWGIEAFTGRRPELATALSAQGDRYSLIVRANEGDTVTEITSIVRASDGMNGVRWRAVLADPHVAVLTLTITEAGYQGTADTDAPARIVDGLRARRDAGAGPLAIVSCDNLPANGEVTRAVVLAAAERNGHDLAEWIDSSVSFVSTMVDRITPATTPDDVETVTRLTGRVDVVPVVTEPFTEWILCGEFPAGRPTWEAAGARFVERLEPFENRKLWLLNAAHSLLAYTGLARGHATIDEAAADPWCAAAVERLWGEAREVLEVPVGELPADEIDAALAALRQRFGNRRIRHHLTQIAKDGSLKLPPRIVEVQRRRLRAGLPVGGAGALTIAAWLRHLAEHPGDVSDVVAAAELAERLPALHPAAQVDAVLGLLAPDLIDELTGPVTDHLLVLTRSLEEAP